MASSSFVSVFDNYRFKSAFNEELSYVRGKVVDFSPENLRNVMRFRAHVEDAATDFETRKEHDQQLDQV
ncbi:hypothetical protein PIB30_099159 [Stylosanthes scabra]|uniref:Uncharacterized protein n=1 Tax=Stylosanthes scabra TaxID=79078 RepID=A0ABU6SX16_9FABA|nr:hypothetical protein [Stylosanthes scabra]